MALEFDDAGKAAGLAGAAATTAAQFDADRVAVLDYLGARADVDGLCAVGFCIGGHLAFRAAFDPRVAATVCFYPTGLHDGALGADADAGSLAPRPPTSAAGSWSSSARRTRTCPPTPGCRSSRRCTRPGSTTSSCTSSRAASTRSCATSAPGYDPELTDLALRTAVAFLRR